MVADGCAVISEHNPNVRAAQTESALPSEMCMVRASQHHQNVAGHSILNRYYCNYQMQCDIFYIYVIIPK